jgi:hypothetical protein
VHLLPILYSQRTEPDNRLNLQFYNNWCCRKFCWREFWVTCHGCPRTARLIPRLQHGGPPDPVSLSGAVARSLWRSTVLDSLFQSHLTGRTQFVSLAARQSPLIHAAPSGVPRGSVLKPILLTLYMQPTSKQSSNDTVRGPNTNLPPTTSRSAGQLNHLFPRRPVICGRVCSRTLILCRQQHMCAYHAYTTRAGCRKMEELWCSKSRRQFQLVTAAMHAVGSNLVMSSSSSRLRPRNPPGF